MRFLLALLIVPLCASGVSSGTSKPGSVVTGGADDYRDNWFSQERILTPANVAGGTFGKVAALSVTGRVMAQPLIAQGVTVSRVQRDLVIVASLTGYLYAFDANSYASVWTNSDFVPGVTPSNSNFYGGSGGFGYYGEAQGCASTPVLDSTYIYAACSNASGTWILHKVALSSGTTAASATITGQYPGTGDPNGGDTVIGGQLQFRQDAHYNRTALTLGNGNVYISFGGIKDTRPWHGWVIAYSTSSMTEVAAFCVTPSSFGGGVWDSAAGLAMDGSGNLYAYTGNGAFDGITSFANSIIKLSPSLALLDWFTPSTWATLEADDLDISSGHAMLMFNGAPLIVGGAKDFRSYILPVNCMGHLQGSGSCANQIWTISAVSPSAGVGIYGGVFANNTMFLAGVTDVIRAFQFDPVAGTFNQTPAASTSATFAFPGAAQMSYSSNGIGNGILWAVTCATESFDSPQQGTLRAFNPATMAEIWNSTMVGGDAIGQLNRYNPPTVWGGRVFVGTSQAVYVYGLGAH